jgi:hypothetical protein
MFFQDANHHALISTDGVIWIRSDLPAGWQPNQKGGYNAASDGLGNWMIVGQQGVYTGVDSLSGSITWTFRSNSGQDLWTTICTFLA